MPRLIRPRLLVLVAALFALFFPSSVGGVISPTLGRLAIGLNALLLGGLLVAGCRGTRLQIAIGSLLMGWLALVTLLSTNAGFSAGAALIFVGLGLLLMLDVRAIEGGQPARRALIFINVFSIAVGIGQALDVGIVNRFTKAFYSSFYPGLLVSMIDWNHKPVLTFATHSTAGFFLYLFFYLNFSRFRRTGSLTALGVAILMIVLGFNLRSTTGTVLMALASGQVGWELLRRHPRWRSLAAGLALALVVVVVVRDRGLPARYADSALRVIRGDKGAGLRSRFWEGGTIAGNLDYLRRNPFSPIGFRYGPRSLFYGDSGIVLVLLRGSLPLLLLTYGGFAYLLARNLASRRDAFWLLLVTCAFEIGYTPLQLFRFTSFLPFAMVYLNDLARETRLEPGRPE